MASNRTYVYSSLKGIPSTTIYNEKYVQPIEFVPNPITNKFYFNLDETSKSMCTCSDCTTYGCPNMKTCKSQSQSQTQSQTQTQTQKQEPQNAQEAVRTYFQGQGCFLNIGSAEKNLPGWKGVQVESAKSIFERTPASPTVSVINAKIDVHEDLKNNTLTYNGLIDRSPYKFFDYINIDNIGTNPNVLKQIPLSKTQIVCVNNFKNPGMYEDVQKYCKEAGLTKCIYRGNDSVVWAR
jgi:hypothetical protein